MIFEVVFFSIFNSETKRIIFSAASSCFEIKIYKTEQETKKENNKIRIHKNVKNDITFVLSFGIAKT